MVMDSVTRRSRNLVRAWRWLPLSALALFGATCERTIEYEMPLENEVSWPYWPVSMRIHPLTRFVQGEEEGEYWLEARIEFRDRDQDIAKAYGLLELKLFTVLAAGDSGNEIQGWDINLLDLAENRQHYDVVTSTYLCRLDVDRDLMEERMELYAYFRAADGRELTTSFLIGQ